MKKFRFTAPLAMPLIDRRSLLRSGVSLGALLPLFRAGLAQAAPPPARKPPAKPAAPPPPAAPTTTANGYPWIETAAAYAFVIDTATNSVLLDKNGDQRMFPSSMAKMMTSYLLFEKLQKGEMRLEDQFPVSEAAWRLDKGNNNSSMFAPLGSRIAVSDLLRGIIVQSGNDACIVAAEGVAGSEEAFVEMMNKKARELGMAGSQFRNASGLPDPEQWTTPRDLALLARRTILDHPEFYRIYSEREFTYNGIKQGNRNPLLYRNSGADGLKTGHTQAAGYGITASVVRENRRIIMVLNGMKSSKERAEESDRLIEWSFREFENVTLFRQGDVIERADVWLGSDKQIALIAPQGLVITVPRRVRRDLKVTVAFDAPIKAPIAKDQPLGELIATAPSIDPIRLPLVAGSSVSQLGMFGRMGAAVSYLLLGSGSR